MDSLASFANGLATVLSPENLAYSLIGVVIGNLVGVLPGIGPLAAISMLLPITFGMDPTPALIMLAGIYYGTQYGGAITAILLNIPGEASSAVTCLDGHPMARQGRAGAAIFAAMYASFAGAVIGILLLMALSPLLVTVALRFGSAEYFSLMVLGLVAAATLAHGSPLKSMSMILLGLLIGLAGLDMESGTQRFTFGFIELFDGVSIVAVAVGLFGISDVFLNANREIKTMANTEGGITLRSMLLPLAELRRLSAPTLRGSGVGSFFGVLPGGGITISAFMAYALEKRVAVNPERFGRGAIEGVASPEAANNAATQTSFIPTLALGIPGNAVMALMLGALMIYGIQPGPRFPVEHPDIFWALIASFWVGNVLLLVLNLPLVGVWAALLKVPYRLLYPTILLFVCIGVYSINNALFDVGLALVFGLLGYGMVLCRFEPAPLLLGYVLGPMLEENFRRAMLLSRGNPMIFVERPISAVFIAGSLLLVGSIIWSAWRARRTGRMPAGTSGDAA